MITGLYLTDTHDKGRNPGARIDDYHKAILSKIREAIDTAIANDCDFIVHGGDWFDTPRVAYSLYNEHQAILRRAKKKGIDVYVVPGNHDLYGYSMKTLNQTAIGALVKSGLVKLLTRKKTYSYVADDGTELFLHGREYDKDIDKDPATDYYIDAKGDYDILISHGMLLEKPFHPDVRHTLTKDVVTNADLVLNGHYHPGYKMHTIGDTTFYNIGSTARDEGNKDNMTRMPQYALIRVDKNGIDIDTQVYKVAQKGKDIFDRTQIVQKKQHTRYLEAFEQTIEDALVFEAFDPKDILSKTKGVNSLLIDEALDAIVEQEKLVQDGKLDGYVEKKKPISIDEVEIINFQSHKKTVFNFNQKGLNAITGPSDSGKSAAVRAIRWVLYNEPKGADFIRNGATRTTATVRFSDGSSITRSRTKSSSGEYIIRDENGKEKTLKGFGANMPIDIANVHQMPKVELSTGVERPLNFSYQLDGHFLLSETASVRANTIGRLTGVHVVDAAIKEKAKEIRKFTIATNSTEKQIEELDESLKSYDHLEEDKKQLNVLKGMILTADNLSIEIDELQSLEDEYSDHTIEAADLKQELKQYKHIDKGLLLIAQAEDIMREIKDLKNLRKEYKDLKEEIAEIKLDLAEYEDVDSGIKLIEEAEVLADELQDLHDLEDLYTETNAEVDQIEFELNHYKDLAKIDVVHMESLYDEIQDLKGLYKEFNEADDTWNNTQMYVVAAKEHVKDLEQQVVELFKQSGNKCPLCLQDVSEEAIDGLLSHV